MVSETWAGLGVSLSRGGGRGSQSQDAELLYYKTWVKAHTQNVSHWDTAQRPIHHTVYCGR